MKPRRDRIWRPNWSKTSKSLPGSDCWWDDLTRKLHLEKSLLDHGAHKIREGIQCEILGQLIGLPGGFEYFFHGMLPFQPGNQRNNPGIRAQRGLQTSLDRKHEFGW